MTTRRHNFGLPLALGALLALVVPVAAADEPTGEQIYRKQCASCHGARGEGTHPKYPRPLHGDRTPAQLAKLIARTMPKDAEEFCSKADADKVAAYIHTTFYSRKARERNKPARVELSRLTVRQYRNAVADLLGTFRGVGQWGTVRGLRGEYFKSRRFGDKERVIDRLDAGVAFDFGTNGPEPDKFTPHEFSIRWQGSVLAPETGEYDFIVRTDHAARLWLNDNRRPLVDAWIRSGDDTEHRASIFLVGGRAYPLRLEFSKAKQGVVDPKLDKPKPPAKAMISLEWKPPRRAAEVIPARLLSPNRFPEALVVKTAFPPDDRSYGWERGTAVSRAWDQATTDAALEAADYIVPRLPELAGTRGDAPDRDKKLREFCKKFAERAFRRPLSAELQRVFVDRLFERGPDPETAAKWSVVLVLKSPRFLYGDTGADGYAVASRLALALWDSLPDAELQRAAAAGELSNPEQVRRQAGRMLTDLRARAKVRDFFLQWVKAEPVPDLSKDTARFPGFDAALVADLRTSLELFLDEVIWGESSDFRQLLLADSVYLNDRLAEFYGAQLPADTAFRKVPLAGDRAGVLTHPYLLATFAYTGTSSPIHRGVFLVRDVLGQTLRPPPEAFAPLSPDLHPKLTTRERVALQTKPQTCQVCHGIINPLGYTLENFDAVGRFRSQEKDRPVDATGSYLTRSGDEVKFRGVRELAKFLANSEEVQDAFVEHVFHHLAKQPIRAYGPQTAANLRRDFTGNGFNIRRLLVETALIAALPPRERKE